MSLKEFLSDYTVKVKREVEPLIAALPENLTSADTDAVNEIKAIVDVAVGYGVDTADIEGYDDLEKRLYDFVEIKDIEKNVDFDEITIDEVVSRKLAAMDLTASIMCMEQKMPMLVFALEEKDSIINAVSGKFTGTKVTV